MSTRYWVFCYTQAGGKWTGYDLYKGLTITELYREVAIAGRVISAVTEITEDEYFTAMRKKIT